MKRKCNMRLICARTAAGALALALLAIPVLALYATVTDLGTAGALQSYAYGINDAGQVLGQLYFQATAHAYFWESGTMTDLGTLGGSNTSSYASTFNKGINKFGQVVGHSQIDGGAQHAF